MTASRSPTETKLAGRWGVLAAGMLAQSSTAALQQGLPALGPVLRASFDLSLPALGALLAAVSWGVMLTIYLWGRMADIWGERVVVVAGLSGATLALLGVTLTETAVGLGVAIGVAGAFSGSAIAASGRAVMGWFSRSERGLALGLRQMAVPLGAGMSALVLPAAALAFGVQGAFVVLALLSLAGAVVAWFVLRAPPGTPAKAADTQRAAPIRDPALWRLSTASGLIQWSQVAMNSFLAVILVERQGVSLGTAAALFATVQLFSGLIRVFAGWLSDRSGRRVPHLTRLAVALSLSLLIAAIAQGIASTFSIILLVIATILSFSWNGLAFASVAEMAGRARAGSALGLHATLMRAMTIPTAMLFGWVAATAGWGPALAILALFPAAGALLVLPLTAEEDRRAALVD